MGDKVSWECTISIIMDANFAHLAEKLVVNFAIIDSQLFNCHSVAFGSHSHNPHLRLWRFISYSPEELINHFKFLRTNNVHDSFHHFVKN